MDSLNGRYVTTTDVGSTGRDLEHIAQETEHVAGLPVSLGGSGEHLAWMTGLGVYMGMKACAKAAWGTDSLSGRTVALQGFGKVAYRTAEYLVEDGANLVATDVFEEAREKGPRHGGPGGGAGGDIRRGVRRLLAMRLRGRP